MENNPQTFYSGAFLYNPKNQSVLLHLRDNNTLRHPGQWAFFGGRNEGDESPEDCCIRELGEELGISAEKEELIPLCNYLNTNQGTWRYIFYIESDREKSSLKLMEGADFDWIPLDKAFEYNLTDKTRADLEKFINKLGLN